MFEAGKSYRFDMIDTFDGNRNFGGKIIETDGSLLKIEVEGTKTIEIVNANSLHFVRAIEN